MNKSKKLKKRVVVIGGGSGVFNVLNSLTNYFTSLSAIVTMADDGGSTGKLREDFGILPPGDVRRALVALAPSNKEILSKLFNYRFSEGRGLKGHSFGNLLITALERITGDFESALTEAGRILNSSGRVIPVTKTKSKLVAELEDGKCIVGETNIDIPKHNGGLKIVDLRLRPKAALNPRALKAIKRANLIIIGPGDLYTSVLANVVVDGMANALKKSRARKVFVVNVMNKFGETNDFNAQDFIDETEKYIGKKVIDYYMINSKRPSKKILAQYKKKESSFVEPKVSKDYKKRTLLTNLIRDNEYIRHDGDKLAKILIKKVL